MRKYTVKRLNTDERGYGVEYHQNWHGSTAHIVASHKTALEARALRLLLEDAYRAGIDDIKSGRVIV